MFDSVIASSDMFEWSIEATLNAAHKHDTKVIAEADEDEEFT
mgnify:CR=1 FL=1